MTDREAPRSPRSMDPLRHLEGLTAAQAEAAQHAAGPMLVVAGPGSGKTRTLTARLSHLVDSGAARPEELLAVTFTRKAAAEVRARLLAQLGPAARGVTVGTFHAVSCMVCPVDGVPVLSEGDRLALLRRAAQETGQRVRPLQEALVRTKGNLLGDAVAGGEEVLPAEIAAGLAAYERLREGLGAVDLDDLLLRALRVLQAGGAAGRRWRLVSIDEYQDTNRVQRELARALAGPEGNVFAIGDPDQAIYSFRGADVRNFLAFTADFPGARVVRLGDNFRSTATIVGAAQAVIACNRQRAPGAERPAASRGAGAQEVKIVRIEAASELAEAERIALEIERLVGGTSLLSHDSGRSASWERAQCSFCDIAILSRTAARADALAQALGRAGVPIQRPRRALFERDEAQDLCAYLRFARQGGDAGEEDVGALFRVLLREAPALLSVMSWDPAQRGPGGSLWAALHGVDPVLHGRLLALRADLRDKTLAAQVEQVAMLLGTPAEVTEAALRRVEADPSGLLADDGTGHESDDLDPRAERVSVLTLHGSKGLEFPVVFLAGCEARLLPGERATPTEVEEERRLFYVGLTRARDALYLSWVRREGSAPSPFLGEIPVDLLAPMDAPVRRRRGQQTVQMKLF